MNADEERRLRNGELRALIDQSQIIDNALAAIEGRLATRMRTPPPPDRCRSTRHLAHLAVRLLAAERGISIDLLLESLIDGETGIWRSPASDELQAWVRKRLGKAGNEGRARIHADAQIVD
jgi:hypothetical protein